MDLRFLDTSTSQVGPVAAVVVEQEEPPLFADETRVESRGFLVGDRNVVSRVASDGGAVLLDLELTAGETLDRRAADNEQEGCRRLGSGEPVSIFAVPLAASRIVCSRGSSSTYVKTLVPSLKLSPLLRSLCVVRSPLTKTPLVLLSSRIM